MGTRHKQSVMEKITFYRVGNNTTGQGLWYDTKGNFTGLIHKEFDFCMNNKLPMPFDEEVIGWVSATNDLEDLFNWFTREDIKTLELFGYQVTVYEATEYKLYQNHWLIKQDSSVLIEYLKVDDIPTGEEKEGCTCSNGYDDHTCPFSEEIHNDSDSLCNCCPECEYQCGQDI